MTDPVLRAVLEDPTDDLPRLAYADRLAERGDWDRAEFVQRQVRLAREWPDHYEVPHCRCQACDDRRACQALPARHKADWVGPAWPSVIRFNFYRGFVEWVEVGVDDFIACAPLLFPLHPVVEVRAADRRAYPFDRYERVAWFHPGVPGSARGCALPEGLFLRLEGYDNRGATPYHVRWYNTRVGANAALSAAMVSWGREAVGLPALGWAQWSAT